jgi:phosphate uptake regulator
MSAFGAYASGSSEAPADPTKAASRGSTWETPASRRLQRMGAVTVGVSLPRPWVEAERLDVGSPVYVRDLGSGSLLIRSREEEEFAPRAVVVVRPGESSEHVFRRLVGAYLAGAVDFVLHAPDGISSETRNTARLFARRTIQPEIVTEEPTTILLRDVSRGLAFSVPQLLHRMFQLVVDLQTDSTRAWQEEPRLAPEGLARRDDDVDRYAWLVERILAMQLGRVSRTETGSLGAPAPLKSLLVARHLERIADHALLIAELGRSLGNGAAVTPVRQALLDFHDQALRHLQSAFRVAEAPDADAANGLIDHGEALHATHATLFERFQSRGTLAKLSPPAIAALGLLLHSIDRVVSYTQDIAEVGLDLSARPTAAAPRVDTTARRRRRAPAATPAPRPRAGEAKGRGRHHGPKG